MRYTPDQYYNMCVHVESDIMDAELHNGRIIKHLEESDTVLSMHKELQEILLKAISAITSITDLLEKETEQ